MGGAGAAFSFMVYYWLVGSFGDTLGYIWPSIIISVVWFPLAFFLHRRFVFGDTGKILTAFIKFVSAQWAFFMLGPILLVLLVEFIGLTVLVAYASTMVLISLLSFAVSRLLVFRAPSPSPSLRSDSEPTSSDSER